MGASASLVDSDEVVGDIDVGNKIVPTNLPKEMYIEISLYLGLRDLSRLFRVSKGLCQVFSGDIFWKLLIMRDFGIDFGKMENSLSISPLEFYKRNSHRIPKIDISYFRKNRKRKNLFKEVEGKLIDKLWSNCICCDGNIVAFSFEKYNTYFVAFDCQTGKKIGHSKGGDSHCVVIHRGLLYVGTDTNIRVYEISDNFKYLRTFGGNTAKLPRISGRMSEEEYLERERLRNGHSGMVTHICFTKDYIISGASDGYTYAWKKDSFEFVGKIHSGGFVESMDCQGDYLAICCGHNVHVYSISDFKLIGNIPSDYSKVAFCGDILLVCEEESKNFKIFKIERMKNQLELVLKKKKKFKGGYVGRRISTDSNSLIQGSGNIIMTVLNGKTVRVFEVNEDFKNGDFGKSVLFDLTVDTSKYQETQYCLINGASFSGRNVYLGIGRFNFSFWRSEKE